MSIVQRLVQRPVKQFPERDLRRPVQQNTTLNGFAGQFSQGLDNGIHLDFANNFHYIKKPGQDPQIDSFTNLFTFTGDNKSKYRASTGLLVASQTNTPRIEYNQPTVTNLCLQSSGFDSASWTGANLASISANVGAIVDPAGTTIADALNESAANGQHRIDQSITLLNATKYTFSVFVKAAERQSISMRISSATTVASAAFNLVTGAITINNNGTAAISNNGNGWYRCSITGTTDQTSCVLRINIGSTPTSSENDSYVGDINSKIYVWGAQLEQSSQVGVYTATTTTPATSYLTPTCLGLLMEGARTNLCLQSEDLTTTWANANATASANTTTAPDGNTTADTIVEDSSSGAPHNRSQSFTGALSNGVTYTFSVFVKAKERTWANVRFIASSGGVRDTYVNLSTGALGTTASSTTATVQAYANGWYRVSVTATNNGVNGSVTVGPATGDTQGTYNGDGASGIYAWGAQFEVGAFLSSYIPTTTASVARAADVATRTLSTEFSATAGTAFVETNAPGLDITGTLTSAYNWDTFMFHDGTNNQYIAGGVTGLTTGKLSVVDGGVSQAGVTVVVSDINGLKKIAHSWKANRFQVCSNGTLGTADTSGTVPTVTTLKLNTGSINGFAGNTFEHVKQFKYWPEQKTDDQLQGLTS